MTNHSGDGKLIVINRTNSIKAALLSAPLSKVVFFVTLFCVLTVST